MQIQIGEYLIKSSQYQLRVGKVTMMKNGRLGIKNPRFFSSFDEVAKFLIKSKVQEQDIIKLKTLDATISHLANELIQAATPFKFSLRQKVKYKFLEHTETGVIHERTQYVDIDHKKKSLCMEIKTTYGVYGPLGMDTLFEHEISEI